MRTLWKRQQIQRLYMRIIKRIKIWWSQWAELKFHEARSAYCRILAMTTGFITRWTSKNQILTLIFTLYSYHFCAQFVVFMWNLFKLRSLETLLNRTCSAITLNSRGHYLTSIERYVDQSRRLFILTTTSHDQLTFIGVWSQLVWNGLSEESHYQV